MPPPFQPPSSRTTEREIDYNLPFRIPHGLDLPIDAHKKWRRMVQQALLVLEDDTEFQYKVSKGLRVKERAIPPEILGRMYAEYCALINSMYDAYLSNLQMQRADYILEIITVLMKRMYELRRELVHLIVNDYIYVDSALIQLRMTPLDIQIVVPYHYPLEFRPNSMEQLLQKMWADAVKRKKKAAAPAKKKSVTGDEMLSSGLFDEDFVKEQAELPPAAEEEVEEEEESIVEEDVSTGIPDGYRNAVLLQKHERFRQFAFRDFLQKCSIRRKYFAPDDVKEASDETKDRAMRLIQKFYRRFMELKREHYTNHKRDVLLGIVPDVDRRPLKYKDENNKFYARRRQMRAKIDRYYQEQIEKEKTRLLYVKRGDQIEDITEDIMEWFMEWYYGYGFFPQYPYELEGGTILVVNGQYPTIDERKAEDEKYIKATKGKTKEQLKQEKQQAKLEAQMKAEIAAEKAKKEKIALFKARCNPLTDPGYEVKMSEHTGELFDVLTKYRQSWSIFDSFPLEQCAEVIYGYIDSVIREDLMQEIHLEARKIVDEMMRLELKLFIKAQQAMYKRVEWKWPKQRPRKKPKPPKIPKPFIVDDVMAKSVQPLFDLEIMSKPPSKLDDIQGDMKYAVYEQNIIDPIAKFPPPGYGDVKRRLTLSCILGSGMESGADRCKCVLLLGIPRNGKSFLVDCVAGELGAVKFDISPEVFGVQVKRPAKMLHRVFTAARMFQPSVIFLKNVEKLFYKAVPPQEKKENAKAMRKPLTKLLKTIPNDEKVIFIATCSNPFSAKVRPLMKLFGEKILVPKPDYGTIQRFFYDGFMKIQGMPRDYCVQSLAKILQGIGFGVIMQLFRDVMNPERITKICETPVQPAEFLEYLIVNNIEPVSDWNYQKLEDLYIQWSPLKQEREEYTIINQTRKYVYDKLQKKKQEEAAKKEAAKAKQK